MPSVGARLKGGRLPFRFFAGAVQIIAEERSFDFLAELTGGFVATERNNANGFALGRLPLTVKPGAGDHEVGAIRIVLRGMPENLPWPPRVFLVPETGNIEVGDG